MFRIIEGAVIAAAQNYLLVLGIIEKYVADLIRVIALPIIFVPL